MNDPTPSYDGANLVNLAAELEIRLTGRSPTPGLQPGLARSIPQTRNYLLVIIDGLGDLQLAHPAAAPLRRYRRAALQAPFPTTTTVGLSSVATALPPLQHGAIGYTQWIPRLRTVVNLLAWVEMPTGRPARIDSAGFLPAPNLWERLQAGGVRTVVYQPTGLVDTPLSNMLYRGAEVFAYSSLYDVWPSLLFAHNGRTLAVVYTPGVDAAAHTSGQTSQAYSTALVRTAKAWEHLAGSLPADTTLVGSADHGHCDIYPDAKIYLRPTLTDGLRVWGDGRVLMFNGPPKRIGRIVRRTRARPISADRLRQWLGGGTPHPRLDDFPTGALLAPPQTIILPRHLPSYQVGHHGGITPQELLIPLLIAPHP